MNFFDFYMALKDGDIKQFGYAYIYTSTRAREIFLVKNVKKVEQSSSILGEMFIKMDLDYIYIFLGDDNITYKSENNFYITENEYKQGAVFIEDYYLLKEKLISALLDRKSYITI